MKNKKATLFLCLLVLIVWGAIFFKILNSSDRNSNNRNISFKVKTGDYNDYSVIDTFKLILNYRDPFGLSNIPTEISDSKNQMYSRPKIKASVGIKNEYQLKPTLPESFIKYSGYIRNADSKKLLAILNINGKEVMMAEGQTYEDVKLIKNLRESLKVLIKGKTKIIEINK